MASSYSNGGKQVNTPAPVTRESTDILHALVSVATEAATAQFDAFALRLSDALLKFCESSSDAKEAGASFNAANILKKNSVVFFYLVGARLEEELRKAICATEYPEFAMHDKKLDDGLSLVPYEEMDKTLLLNNISRAFETEHDYQLTSLGRRIAHLLGREELSMSQNPFRPAVFISAFNEAWKEFDPDTKSHALIMPLLKADVFLDLAPILTSLNADLISRGVMPDMGGSYRIKKSNTAQEATKPDDSIDETTLNQLKRIFNAKGNAASPPNTSDGRQSSPGGDQLSAALQQHVIQATAASNQLLGYLAGVQKTMFDHHLSGSAGQQNASVLADIKNQAPHGALSQIDETTIDLLTKIFDVVFHDPNIPTEIKALIGFLQVPVLKAALIDKDFFFKQEHPARKLIDVLTKSSLNWDQSKGQDDPLYQTIKHNVKRVQAEFDQKFDVFSDVVSDLESFISEDDAISEEVLAQPITHALRQEKMGQATKAAKTDISMRVGTGEVVAFVETFLEDKWVSVLTLAYSIKDEKPEALESATKTMDDLVWSVKPKITMAERKDMIAKLPSMLSMLNKWLNIVKLDDTERLQFFAELAECHASIVRAPLEISPQRQLEIAMEAAQKAAERRREKQLVEQPAPEPDAAEETVQNLSRGTWFEFAQDDGTAKKVKLAWVSPLRSLYIFSTGDKVESFSLSAEELALNMRDNRATIVQVSGLVDRALVAAMQDVGANDPAMESVA